MNLDDAQRQKVSEWIKQGLKLSEIQSRMTSELGVTITYMDVRLLVDDLKLVPKDVESPKAAASALDGPPSAATAKPAPPSPARPGAAPAPGKANGGGVSIQVDQLARPGAVVSGKVTFSDGNGAEWYFDQMGRLGLVPEQPGYRPPGADLQKFQAALESELARLGMA